MRYKLQQPAAIAMWDFSWLERRWPGGGYEDWDRALDELQERGYNAVRIDPYPHFIAFGTSDTVWQLPPVWPDLDWGSPAALQLHDVQGNLIVFMEKCKARGLQVGLSTWFREDARNVRMFIHSPQMLADIWKRTLELLGANDLLDMVLYVDLTNEYPNWVPFITGDLNRVAGPAVEWMNESLDALRRHYPEVPLCFSYSSEFDTLDRQDPSHMDLLEPHIWMVDFSDFYRRAGIGDDEDRASTFKRLARSGAELYAADPAYWVRCLLSGIRLFSEYSVKVGKPLITTECWGVIFYKDWPTLRWDWVKALCEFGTIEASKTGRWAAIATSNFAGPQFRGMWDDIAWHRRLTDIIHRGALPDEARPS
ncbi:cellulase-like family protein [Cohnella sp. 56]|uniref:cellulase-like family protein n=1 Tax=Cohnella sp. 56 TaxID=3113722 RepID=UPI0030E82C21